MAISVRMPSEVRKYKEKVFAGLTARQLLSVVAALMLCLPIYIGGLVNGINEELVSWVVMVMGGLILSFGFLKYQGMHMEVLAVVMLKYLFFPTKRVIHTSNTYRDKWQRMKNANKPTGFIQRLMEEKYKKEEALERVALAQEAEQQGDTNFNPYAAELLTVRKPGGSGGKKPDKNKKKEKRKPEVNKLEQQASEILAKQAEDPFYVPTKTEKRILQSWKNKQLQDRRREIEAGKREVAKKSNQLKKRRTATLTVPRGVADSIPIVATYKEGLFEVAPNKYSKMYRFSDINYAAAAEEQQQAIFCGLRDFYNSFGEDVHIGLFVDNRVVSMEEKRRDLFFPMMGDSYDIHRKEFNRIMSVQMSKGHNDTRLEKYITVTIDSADPMEALLRFRKLDDEVIKQLGKMGVIAKVVSTTERLSYFHDKFRPGHEGELRINYEFLEKEGLSEKDYIAPTSFDFKKLSSFMIGENHYRVLYLTQFPQQMDDTALRDLYDVDFPVTVSLNIQPVEHGRAMKLILHQLTGVKGDKMKAESKAIKQNYSPENIKEEIKAEYDGTKQVLEDVSKFNQELFFTAFTVMVQGNTAEELENNCKILQSRAKKHQAQLVPLNFQQEEAYKMTLPFGYVSKELKIDRSTTSESTAIFIPFTCTELYQVTGLYYGLNAISRNFIKLDRTSLRNASGYVLGTSGSGKSFGTKREILSILLSDKNANVIIFDPENEYSDFCRAFGGTVLKVSPDSDLHFSPMDMPPDYGLDENDPPDLPLTIKKQKALTKKSGFIMSIVERMISYGGDGDTSTITPTQKTIVDQCVRKVYEKYLENDFDPAYLPTLMDLQDVFDGGRNNSAEWREVADGIEYYTRGSMNAFAHKTNVDINNRLVCFNIRDMGEQLERVAMVILFDFVWNRALANKNENVLTYLYVDEIHIMFRSFYCLNYLKQFYKRGRKYGLVVTAMTQNAAECLATEQARMMIGNSDFVMLFNQKSEDLRILSAMLGISREESEYVHGSDPGSGLLCVDKVIVPFRDDFPSDSYLYKLMSTKFGEDMSSQEVDRIIAEIMKSAETAA